MTWGTKESDPKQPPPAYTSAPATIVPVTAQYEHHPRKSVIAVSSIILISGIFCLFLGITKEVIAQRWHGLGLGCGIFFIITGIVGIVSVHRRTKARLIATAVLALLATLAAAWLASYLSDWYWKSVAGRGMEDKRHDRRTRGADSREHHDDRRDRRPEEDMYDYILGINCWLCFFSLLVFCCSIPLTVFSLKTVTSPRNGALQGQRETPIVAFPYSKDPNQLDSFNGNDYI